MRKLKHTFMLILISIVALSGCAESRIIDDVRIVEAIGFDYDQNQELVRQTLVTPIYFQTGGSGIVQPKTDILTADTKKGSEVHCLIQSESEFSVETGKLLVIMYNEAIAKNGLYNYLDLFKRDTDIGRTVNVAVTESDASEILKGKYQSDPLAAEYIDNLIKNNIKNNFPRTNLHTFLNQYYTDGVDPILPIIKKENEHVQITGIALFKDDVLVGKIPYNQAFLFRMMYEPVHKGSYSLPVKSDRYVSIENIGSKPKYSVNFTGPKPKVTINVKQKGILLETGTNSSMKKGFPTIEKAMKKNLEREGSEMIKSFQKLHVDPLGIGAQVRSRDRNWTKKKWEDIYPNLDILLNVDVSLKQSGITD